MALTAVNPEPCINFTAVDDDLGLEGQEMLTLSLSGPSNVMFQNVSLTVIIDDGDGMYFYEETPLIRTPLGQMRMRSSVDVLNTIFLYISKPPDQEIFFPTSVQAHTCIKIRDLVHSLCRDGGKILHEN